MKLIVKVLSIVAAGALVAATFLYLNLRHFDSLYNERGREMTEFSAQILLARTIQVDFKKQVQEWKDILLRGHDAGDLEKYRKQFDARKEDVTRESRELLFRIQDSRIRRTLEEFSSAHQALGNSYGASLAAYLVAHDLFASDRLVRGMDRKPTDLLDEVVDGLEKGSVAARAAHDRLWESQRRQAVLISGVFFLLFLAVMGLLSASLARPITALARIMRSAGTGSSPPPARLESRRTDEIGELFGAFEEMQRALQERDQALRLDRNALADREARLHSFTQSVSDGILSTDQSGNILAWNRAAGEMLGYSAEEILGKPFLMIVSAYDQKRLSETMGELLGQSHDAHRSRQARLEVEGLRKDGTPTTLEVSLGSWQSGPETYLGAILRDITEQKKVERLKDEFVSTVNHELRTPLSAIRGSLGLLAGGVVAGVPARAKAMIDLAQRNCERLARLVNDILDIDKIESGKMSFVARPHDVALLVRQAVDMNLAFGEQMGVSLVLDECAEGTQVVLDPDRFLQVMTNLISNAVKFSPRDGAVRLRLTRQRGHVRLDVRDQGPGIPEEFRKRIFQRFAQAETSDARVRQGQGTGLGLAISKAIVDRMKGTIGFETEAGVGTVFFVTLPLVAEHATFRRAHPGPYGLLLGTDGAFAKVAAEALESYGISLATLPNPDPELDLVRDPRCKVVFAGPGVADDLLLPWHAPGSDKPAARLFQVGRARDFGEGASVPTIAASVSAAALAGLLHQELAPLEERHARILHLDEDEVHSKRVQEILGPVARIARATTVEEAWHLLRREPMDLILMDLHLRDGCSLELALLLRGLGRQGLPIVILSDARSPKRLPSSVRTILAKSRTSPEQLMAAVRSLLSRRFVLEPARAGSLQQEGDEVPALAAEWGKE